MSNEEITVENKSYPCFARSKKSTDKDECSHCGAIIGEFDIETTGAIFKAPEFGSYFIPYSFLSEKEVIASIKISREENFQNFYMGTEDVGVWVISND